MPWEPPDEAFIAAAPVYTPKPWRGDYPGVDPNLNYQPPSSEDDPNAMALKKELIPNPVRQIYPDWYRGLISGERTQIGGPFWQQPQSPKLSEVQDVYYDTDSSPKPPTTKEGAWQPPEEAFTTDTKSGSYLDDHLGGGLKGYGSTFESVGKKYGVDPALLASMSMFETANGTSHVFRTLNNTGGITGTGHSGIGGNYRPFASVEDSIDEQGKMIAQYRDKHGLTTIPQIGARWAGVGEPNDPNNTNAEWPSAVASNYRKITGTNYGGGTSAPGGWEPPAEAFTQTPGGTSAQTPGGTGWSPPENAFAPQAQPVGVKPAGLVDLSPAAGAESYGASAATTPAPAPDPNAPPPGYSQTQTDVRRATPVDTTKVLSAVPLSTRRAQPVDVQTALPASAGAESYGASASTIPAPAPGGGPHEANDPFEIQIRETQVNPDLTDAQKAWMIQSLRIQQAKTEPHVERALPVNQEVPGMYDKYAEGYDLSSGLSGPGPKVERVFPVEQPGIAPKPTSIHGLGGFVDQTWKDLASTWADWHAGAKQEQGLAPEVNDPYEQAIRELQTNPDMTEAQKQDATLKLRSQQMAARTANIAETIPATSEAKRAAAQIDQEYAKTFPGRVAGGLAGGLAYVPSFATGPMAPFVAATQATAGAFHEQLDQGIARSHDTHPEWTDEQRLMAALSAATEGAKGAGEGALALSFVNIPVAGPLISRIVQKIGIGAGSMEIANVLATVQRNMALKKTIDPSQDILEGLRDLNSHLENLIAGGVYAAPHAVGEIGRGKAPITPQEPIESRPAIIPPGEAQKPPRAEPVPTERQPAPPPTQERPLEPKVEQQPLQPGEQRGGVVEENGELIQEPKGEPQPVAPPSEEIRPTQLRPQPTIVNPRESKEARNARQEYEQEMQGNLQQGQPELLSEIQKAGGLPTVQQLRRTPGENLTGELGRVYNAWKALDQDTKNWLKKQGVMPSKLFRHDAPGLDTMRDNLAQSEGFNFEHPHEMLSEVEDALRLASDRKLSLAQRYASVPGAEEPFTAIPRMRTPERRELPSTAGVPGRYEWDELTGKEQADYIAKVKPQFEAAFQRARPAFEALGVTGRDPGGHLAARMTPEGELRLVHDMQKWAPHLYRSETNGLKPDAAYFDKALNEELVHFAHHAALRDRWQRSQKGRAGAGSLSEFIVRENNKIWNSLEQEAQRHEKAGNQAAADDLRNARDNSFRLYHGLDPWEHLPSLSEREKSLATYELVRQLVQIRRPGTITEELWRHITNFWKTALDGLRKLAGGVNQPAELQRIIRETEANLHRAEARQPTPERTARQRLYKQGTLNLEGGNFRLETPISRAIREARGEGPAPEAPTIRGAIERVKAIGRGIGRGTESIAGPNREVVARQPHTGELIRGLDDFRAREGELHGRVAVANQRYKELLRRNPKLSTEIDDIGRKVSDGGAIPANISPEAREVLRTLNNGIYRDIGDRMRAGGYKTVLPDGSTRPFIGAPKDVTPFPRVMRPDVANVLSRPILDARGNFTPEAQKIYDEGRRTINKNTGQPYFQKPEDFTDYVRQYNLNQRRGPEMTNLERARVLKYPSFFYTYSPEAMLNGLWHQGTELARLESFGQKIGGQQDLFDKTTAKINDDLSMSGAQKQHAIDAIGALRNNIYGLNRRGVGIRLLRGASSASLAGSPHTSAKIGLSMLFNVPAYRGVGRTLLGIFDHVFRHTQSVDELRRLGLKSDIMLNLHDDPYSVTSAQKTATNIFTGILRLAGHSLAQDIGKSVTARASRAWLEGVAIPKLQADPSLLKAATRMVAADVRRRGIDPSEFSKPNIEASMKDRFVREDVQDLQTAYRSEDYPAWASTQAGSVMFQFGHWAYNASRTIIRDTIAPLVTAMNPRHPDIGLIGHYSMRLAATALATAGASEAWRELDKLFGRQSNVATVGEIMQAFARGNPEAAHMLMSRFLQDIVGSPTIGMFGDLYNWGKGTLTGTADTTHFFNPATPAAIGWLKVMQTAVNHAAQQGWKLSDRQKADAVNQMLVISGLKGVYDVANTLGAPLPGHAEAVGRRENNFVKSRLDVFYEMHPEWDKRMKGSTFAGNTHTPYLQDLNESLLAGDTSRARRIMQQMKTDLKLDPKTLKTSVTESVDSHRPIPGGTVNKPFIDWARRTMTPDELQRTHSINRLYEHTAERVGINVKESD